MLRESELSAYSLNSIMKNALASSSHSIRVVSRCLCNGQSNKTEQNKESDMVIILDGNSKMDAHVIGNLC